MANLGDGDSGENSIFQTENDPLQLKQYVDKFVQIVVTDGTKFTGKVFTIDPSSNSVVLVQKEDDTLVDIIMGHAIHSINVVASTEIDCEVAENIFASASLATLAKLSDEDIISRKEKLRSWLLLNKIPVEEDGKNLKLQGSIEFLPPFGKEDCRSLDTNELILGRILDLLAGMPE